MKLNISDTEVQGTGFEQVAGFKIDMNAKAFKVLSDTLYKNKIGSIVRELSCNAYDAHIDAGNADQPFDIHLPDSFEPYFSIRDYGKGISPEDIKTIYTSYFTSTKDQANDSVGAFGLGSKTPFSYTDSFTVISIHNGIKTVYNAHMSQGMPAIVAYGESEPTDEPDGLEVNVSVESVDHKAFSSAVRDQLKFFPVKPNTLNGTIEWAEYEPVIEVPGFTMYKIAGVPNRPMWGSGNKKNILQALFLKQGPVAYPVDFDVINQYLDSNNIKKTDFYKYLESGSSSYGKGIIIEMPIGTVEVTASREGISYSDLTIRNMLTKFDTIAKAIYKDVERLLDNAYSEGNGAFIKQFNELDSYFKSSLQTDQLNKRFTNFVFTGNTLVPRLKLPTAFDGTEIRKYDLASYTKPKMISSTTLVHEKDDDGNDLPHISFNMISFVELGVVYVKDVNTNFVARIHNTSNKDHPGNRHAMLVELPRSVSLSSFKRLLGDSIEVYKVSDLEEVKINRKSSGGYSTTGGNNRLWFDLSSSCFRGYSSIVNSQQTLYARGCPSTYGDKFEDAIEDGGNYVYVATHTNKVNSEVNDFPFLDKDKMGLFATWLTEKGYKLVAISSNDTKKAEKTGAFISFGDAWKKHNNEFIDSQWEIFGRVVMNEYYRIITVTDISIMHGFSSLAPLTMDQMFVLFDTLNIDYSVIKQQLDDVRKEYEEKYAGTIYNSAMREIIEEYMPKKLDLYDSIVRLYINGNHDEDSNTLEAFESYLREAGLQPVHKLSSLLKRYATLIEDNAHKLIAVASFVDTGQRGEITPRRMVINNPVVKSATDGAFLTENQILNAIKKGLGIKT